METLDELIRKRAKERKWYRRLCRRVLVYLLTNNSYEQLPRPDWCPLATIILVVLCWLLMFLTCAGPRSSPHGGYAPDYEQESSDR